jgi:hypothetical protein
MENKVKKGAKAFHEYTAGQQMKMKEFRSFSISAAASLKNANAAAILDYFEINWKESSTVDLVQIFPFLSEDTIENCIKFLESLNLIGSAYLNENKMNRVKSYRVTTKGSFLKDSIIYINPNGRCVDIRNGYEYVFDNQGKLLKTIQ